MLGARNPSTSLTSTIIFKYSAGILKNWDKPIQDNLLSAIFANTARYPQPKLFRVVGEDYRSLLLSKATITELSDPTLN